MSEEEYRKVFVQKLNYYMNINGKTQKNLMDELGLSSATVSSWCNGKKLPRMGKIQMLADYFGIDKSDLIEDNHSQDEDGYYLDPETAKKAQEIFENKDLALLFDAARDASPEDIQTIHTMLLALKNKEKK